MPCHIFWNIKGWNQTSSLQTCGLNPRGLHSYVQWRIHCHHVMSVRVLGRKGIKSTLRWDLRPQVLPWRYIEIPDAVHSFQSVFLNSSWRFDMCRFTALHSTNLLRMLSEIFPLATPTAKHCWYYTHIKSWGPSHCRRIKTNLCLSS